LLNFVSVESFNDLVVGQADASTDGVLQDGIDEEKQEL
jgi:hypothetical protein